MTNKQDLEEILIVEDSPTQAERLRYVLEQHGYRVSIAGNGREAMDLLADHRPSLVISDILMPEADGYEVCRFVRQDQDLQKVPVILLTALSDPVDVMRALECGADNFLIKPFEENQLLKRIQLFLLNHDLRKHEGVQVGLEIVFQGQKYFINSDRLQILNLLLSTYEAAVEKNAQLLKAQTELQSQAAELEVQAEELRAQNDELMKMAQELRERTSQLEAANRKLHFANLELESFSYSVSHDLKTPIRAIQAFSRLLIAGEHVAPLDAEGQRLLNVIVDNTKIMNNLIDDLLALSRVGRHQIKISEVDLDALARQVFQQLQEQEPERQIQLTVKDLPRVWGDPSLIKQIVLNLLGNAIKYTRTQKQAEIELGCNTTGEEELCYIKDNGIGFDERYADKLFGVFERLHGGREYEGTGVGLAIVKRIIERHGGRIWAEAKVGDGATFYFALPKKEA